DLLGYATRFEWDKAKYPTTNPVTCLKDLINKVSLKDKGIFALLEFRK
ncbi:unnamed protein product, partial [Tetraodon nigroviridis]